MSSPSNDQYIYAIKKAQSSQFCISWMEILRFGKPTSLKIISMSKFEAEMSQSVMQFLRFTTTAQLDGRSGEGSSMVIIHSHWFQWHTQLKEGVLRFTSPRPWDCWPKYFFEPYQSKPLVEVPLIAIHHHNHCSHSIQLE